MGWTGGYVLLALLLAPYLRKFGKYTVPDFVGERYYSETARIVAAICAIFISLTYVAGQMRGVGIVFGRFLGVEVWLGVVVGMVIVAFFAVLGGMKGITWTQVVQYFILIFAFLVPAFAMAGTVPQIGIATGDISQTLNGLHKDLGFAEYTQPFTEHGLLNVICIAFALMVGTSGLPHVIVRFYTTKTVRAARYSALWALIFIALLYTTAPALAMFARTNLIQSLNDKTIEQVHEHEWVNKWEETGLLKFDDRNGDGVIQGIGQMADGEVPEGAEAGIDPDIIVLSTPAVAGLPGIVIALVAVGGLAAALSTAAGLLLVISSSIAHDLYIHFVDPEASERKRLMVGRIMIMCAIVIAGYFGINPPGFVTQVVAFAFGLAAASFFPVILLGIFDHRTTREGAIAGMILGLLFTGTYILGCRADVVFDVFGVTEPLFEPWFFGIKPEGIGAVGCLLNFAVTMTVSRLTPPPPKRIRELVESVRVPAGAHEPESHFDESDAEADNPRVTYAEDEAESNA